MCGVWRIKYSSSRVHGPTTHDGQDGRAYNTRVLLGLKPTLLKKALSLAVFLILHTQSILYFFLLAQKHGPATGNNGEGRADTAHATQHHQCRHQFHLEDRSRRQPGRVSLSSMDTRQCRQVCLVPVQGERHDLECVGGFNEGKRAHEKTMPQTDAHMPRTAYT